ncbi:MAG TPA: serine hydrolase [Vicinamibacterales bacterium]|nr:serine hydrolase [Vicinamibacterales bacterium]
MRALLFPVLLLALVSRAGAQGPPGATLLRTQLGATLERIAADLDGVMGYTIVDLTSGERIERLASHVFPTASSIKVAILYELFKQADEGRLKLDPPIAWNPKHAVGGSGVLSELTNPTLNLRDYATLMVVLSDNTATNVVIDAIGMERVNARMQALGAGEIRLRRLMMDLEAAKRGNENVSTPAALARLLMAIEKGEGLSGPSRDAVLAMLKKPKTSAMLRGLPPGVPAATKPGDLDGVRADVGIVYETGRPYVFVAMTSWLNVDEEGERAIERASRAVYRYMHRLAISSEFGRGIR